MTCILAILPYLSVNFNLLNELSSSRIFHTIKAILNCLINWQHIDYTYTWHLTHSHHFLRRQIITLIKPSIVYKQLYHWIINSYKAYHHTTLLIFLTYLITQHHHLDVIITLFSYAHLHMSILCYAL